MIKYRVYFEKDSGRILALSNRELELSTYYESFYEDISKFIDGNENLLDYKVVYNITTSNYKIIPKQQKIEIQVNDLIHKIKSNSTYQIKVVKDNINKSWKVCLSNDLRKHLLDVQAPINDNLKFSITKKNNPNILYRHFSCTTGNLLTDDFVLDFSSQEEENLTNFSVYTNRKFEKYSYEVLDVKNQSN